MKKILTIFMSVLLVAAMAIGFTGCSGEEVTLESRKINGVTLDVPSDFGEFTEKNGIMIAQNEDSTANIVVTPVKDAEGGTADAFDQATYQSTQMSTYKDVKFIEFKNNAKLHGVTSIYAHATGTNSKGVKLEMTNYIMFFEDGTYQSIVITFSTDSDSSLKSNTKAVIDSIKIS